MEPLSDESNVDAQRGYEPLLQIPSWALNWRATEESNNCTLRVLETRAEPTDPLKMMDREPELNWFTLADSESMQNPCPSIVGNHYQNRTDAAEFKAQPSAIKCKGQLHFVWSLCEESNSVPNRTKVGIIHKCFRGIVCFIVYFVALFTESVNNVQKYTQIYSFLYNLR